MALLYGQVKTLFSIAWQYRTKREMEDLEQEGYLQIRHNNFDPDAGCKFPDMQHLDPAHAALSAERAAAKSAPVHCLNRFRRCRNIKPNITENMWL